MKIPAFIYGPGKRINRRFPLTKEDAPEYLCDGCKTNYVIQQNEIESFGWSLLFWVVLFFIALAVIGVIL